jgi:hypothetical protein
MTVVIAVVGIGPWLIDAPPKADLREPANVRDRGDFVKNSAIINMSAS